MLPWQRVVESGTIYRLYRRANLERFFVSDIVYTSCNLDFMHDCAGIKSKLHAIISITVIQASRVILERYRLHSNNVVLDAHCLLCILLSFYMQDIYFRYKLYKFNHEGTVVLVFHKAMNFFICKWNTVRCRSCLLIYRVSYRKHHHILHYVWDY